LLIKIIVPFEKKVFQWSGKFLFPTERKNQTASTVDEPTKATTATASGFREGDGVSKTSNDETVAFITVGTPAAEKADVAVMMPEEAVTSEPVDDEKAAPSASPSESPEASPDLDNAAQRETTNCNEIEGVAYRPSVNETSPDDDKETKDEPTTTNDNLAEPVLPESPGEEAASSVDSTPDAVDDTAGEDVDDEEIEDRLAIREIINEADQTKNNEIIELSNARLAIVLLPLMCLAVCFWWLDLITVSTSILSGSFRTFFQLSFLGAFLAPVFKLGVDRPSVVLIYSLSMVALAANEATSRTKYTYDGQLFHILASLLFNVAWVAIFAFAFVLKPKPL
jgi:hypothetical protein